MGDGKVRFGLGTATVTGALFPQFMKYLGISICLSVCSSAFGQHPRARALLLLYVSVLVYVPALPSSTSRGKVASNRVKSRPVKFRKWMEGEGRGGRMIEQQGQLRGRRRTIPLFHFRPGRTSVCAKPSVYLTFPSRARVTTTRVRLSLSSAC